MTFSYLKKHFWLPLVAILPASIAAGFLYVPLWEVAFVTAFDYHPYISGGETLKIVFGDSWYGVWQVIVVAALQVVGAALAMSAVDKHFRSGRLSLINPWRLINNSIFPVMLGVVIMSVVSVLFRLVLFGLVLLIQLICAELLLPAGVALAIISALAVGMFVLHVLAILPMLFWAPVMFIYGYKFRDAAALSFKLIAGKKVFWGLFVPLALCTGIQLIVGFLDAPLGVSMPVDFLVFAAVNTYVPVYVMVTFYAICDLERRDIKAYLRIKVPTVHDAPKAEEPEKPEPPKQKKTPKTKQKSKPATKPKQKATDKQKTAKSEEIGDVV